MTQIDLFEIMFKMILNYIYSKIIDVETRYINIYLFEMIENTFFLTISHWRV